MDAELVRWPVPPVLRADVVRLTGYAERPGAPASFRELPPTFVPLILNVGGPYRVHDGHGVHELRASFVGGLGDSAVDVESAGAALLVQVDLSPLAAARLLGVPMHELAGRTVALDDVIGAGVRRLEDRLAGAATWDGRRALAEEFVLRRLDEARPLPADVVYAWRRLGESAGAIRVGDLASELRCSRKHLAARFRDAVGVPPKTAAALHRFNRARRLLEAGVRPAEVARRCGFADQPHLTREFRRFAGTTPVAFVQDAAAAAA